MKPILHLFALLALVCSHSAAAAQKPNVLFIALDDLNDLIGCLGGHSQTKTPNLDRFAASGVLFRNAYCPAPSCNPSRTAIMSGLPPHRSGLYQNTQKLPEVMPQAELEITPATDQPAPPSKASTVRVTLLFQNQMQKSLKLVWLDEAGQRHEKDSSQRIAELKGVAATKPLYLHPRHLLRTQFFFPALHLLLDHAAKIH